jgi:putative transcriptional regulator
MKIPAAVVRVLEIVFVTFIVVITFAVAVRLASAADLSRPVTLVATSNVAGFYTQAVIVAAPAANGMHVGVIINRPTNVTLATLFPGHAPSSKVTDPIYLGGPVLPEMIYAAVHSAPEESGNILQLMPNVVLVFDGDAIDHIIETTPNQARYFAGLVVWQPGELDEEVNAGAWQVDTADSTTVFSSNPETLWQQLSSRGARLEARTSLQDTRS